MPELGEEIRDRRGIMGSRIAKCEVWVGDYHDASPIEVILPSDEPTLHVPARGVRRAHLFDKLPIFYVDVDVQMIHPKKFGGIDVVDLHWNQEHVIVTLDMRVA